MMKILLLLVLFVSGSKAFAGIEEFSGIVRINGCSASLVKFKNQSMDAKAIVLTTDFCVEDQEYGKFEFNVPHKTNIRLYNKDQVFVDELFVSTRIIYATQTDTDVTLLELENTYSSILAKHGIKPFIIDDAQAPVGTKISVISGYTRQSIECVIDAIAFKLVEGTYISKDSYRLGGCFADMGTAGSPMVLQGTTTIVGITNTSNFDLTVCTSDAICEITQDGKSSVHENTSYGQQLYNLYSCLDENSSFNLLQKGCKMLGGDSWIK